MGCFDAVHGGQKARSDNEGSLRQPDEPFGGNVLLSRRKGRSGLLSGDVDRRIKDSWGR